MPQDYGEEEVMEFYGVSDEKKRKFENKCGYLCNKQIMIRSQLTLGS